MTKIASHTQRLIAGIFIVLLIALFSCTKDIGVVPEAPPPPPEFCDTINYTEDVAPLIDLKCISCHGPVNPSDGVVLSSYAQVKSYADNGRLHGVISLGQPVWMPYGAPNGLPDEEKALIECWINNGTKQ